MASLSGTAAADSVDESPSSPTMQCEPSTSKATEIPVYTVSDSDEDRANALMRTIAQSMGSNKDQSVSDFSQDGPEIIDTEDLVEPIDISEQKLVEETPSVHVTFMNTDIGRKYRHDIEEFFHTLMTAESLTKNQEPLPKIQYRPNLKLAEDDEDTKLVRPTTVIGSIAVYRTFLMDRQGWPMIANMLNQTPGVSVPDYMQDFKETYPPPEDKKLLETRPIKTSKKCFNCGDDGHEVSKCSKPFDRRAFQRNKAKFLASGLQYGRYHKEEKKKNMKAGEISDSLRQALGLEPDELPQHIYRMRQQGYPPGWLLHAEATNSGLAMFDKHGTEVNLDGDQMEDGQVPEHRIRDETNLKYNSEQLIAFPGFNVPCPEGITDRAHSRRGYPPMRNEHSLEYMSAHINIVEEDTGEPSQKRPRYDSASEDRKRFKSSHADMELSDGEDEICPPDIEVIEVPPPPPPDDGEDDDIQEYQVIDELTEDSADDEIAPVSVNNIDDTLNALEQHKQKLLAELVEMEGSISSSTPAQSNPGNSYDVSEGQPPVLNLEDSQDGEHSQDGDTQQNDTAQSSYQSLCYQVTTPVIQHSGIDKLPSYDKFSDGITEHLPYENLPNSTGVYAKMSGVMKEVKKKMATLRPRRKQKK